MASPVRLLRRVQVPLALLHFAIFCLLGSKCDLDSRLFSAGASRILVHALHATRLGRTNFSHAMDLCPWLCDFCEFLHAQLVSRLGANQLSCIFNVATEFWVTFRFGLTDHQSDGASQAHFLPNSQEDEVVQLPFKPALRLRLFSNGLLAPSFLSNLSSNYFPFSVSLKRETSWLFNSLTTLLLEER